MRRRVSLLFTACLMAAPGLSAADCSTTLPDFSHIILSPYSGECQGAVAHGQGSVRVYFDSCLATKDAF
jgi:hypothetical protein